MNIRVLDTNDVKVAAVHSDSILLTDEQSALDFMMTVRHETGCNRIALNKDAISENFFKLSTGLAGNIFQKFINYSFKLAIIGDFSAYTSKPLKDFIYECNRGKDIFFVTSEQDAENMLSGQ